MIVSKTPLRIPLAGGLTDLKPYAERFGGVTVSCTIDKYVYVVLKRNLNPVFDLHYQDVRARVPSVRAIRHDLIRESLLLTGVDTPLDLSILVDLGAESGLGGSGALTVGLLGAMHAFLGREAEPERLYREASRIEVDILEGASGYHDPTICALGGLKLIEYRGADVAPREVAVSPATLRAFEASLLLFYSGRHAKSKPSLDLLTSHIREAEGLLHEIKALGFALEEAFVADDLHRVAAIVGEQQRLKQRLPGRFSDEFVTDVTARVERHGAAAQLPGGKISAFVLVCCPDGQHEAIREELHELEEVPFALVREGTKVVKV